MGRRRGRKGMEKIHHYSDGAKAIVLEKLVPFLNEEPAVLFAYLHGSFLEERGFHDIDIAIYVDPELVPREKALDYEISLSASLDHLIGLPCDVKVLNYAPLGFAYYVTKGRVLISRDEELRYNFVERTWLQYLDFEPHRKELLRELFGAGESRLPNTSNTNMD